MSEIHPLQLLLADDDEACRGALQEFFCREGFAVRVACSGGEALEVLRSETVQFSVMDVNMPGLSGPEVLRTLLESGVSAIPPTILVSSDRSAEALAQALAGIHVGFVPKPIQLAALRRSVKQILLQSRWPPLLGLGNLPLGLPEH